MPGTPDVPEGQEVSESDPFRTFHCVAYFPIWYKLAIESGSVSLNASNKTGVSALVWHGQ